MLLTENTTNDTCQSNLRGAWNDVSVGTQKLSASSLSVYILSVIRLTAFCATQLSRAVN